MNILFFISTLDYGGAEKQAVLDANMLSKEHNVFLCCFSEGPLEALLNKNVKLIKVKKDSYLIISLHLKRIIKQHNVNVVHASLYSSMIVAALASFIIKVNVYWHFHSHEYELPPIHQLAIKWLARLPNVVKICFVNKELIQYFQEKGFNFPRNKIKLLYNNSTIHSSLEKNEEHDGMIIGYVGRLVTIKRVEYLLDLAQYLVSNKLIDFHLQIVGDGDQRNLLEQEVSKKELEACISFVGFQKDVEKYYLSFDLFVNPSQEECLSIALIDAGMSGIPSVAFDVGGNNEIIIDSQTGYIVNTKEEFFKKVFSLISNKTLREEMGKKAKEYCLKHFSEEIHLKQLESLYREVIG